MKRGPRPACNVRQEAPRPFDPLSLRWLLCCPTESPPPPGRRSSFPGQSRRTGRRIEALLDPRINIGSAESDVLAEHGAPRGLACGSPGVDSPAGHAKLGGELLDAEPLFATVGRFRVDRPQFRTSHGPSNWD